MAPSVAPGRVYLLLFFPSRSAMLAGVAKQLEESTSHQGIQLMLRMAEDIQKVPVHDLLVRTRPACERS